MSAAKIRRLGALRRTGIIASTAVLALLLLAAHAWLPLATVQAKQQQTSHRYTVTFNNNLNRGYIWINHRVIVHIWHEDADASYDPEQVIVGELELQATPSHTGFLLPAKGRATGTLTLPAEFQLNRYISNNNEIAFAVHLLIDDIYPGQEDFVPSPKQNFAAAFLRIKTAVTPQLSDLSFNYPSGN